MILRDKKVIFIHIPKTGGQSLAAMLLPNNIKISDVNYEYMTGHDIKNNKSLVHATYEEFLSINNKINEDFKEYFKFAVVRNPWDRVVSQWAKNARKRGCGFSEFITLIERNDLDKLQNFFINKYVASVMCRSQADYILLNGEIQLDKIYRFENYQKEIEHLKNKIKIEAPIVHKNHSNHKHYSEYYNMRLIKRVCKIYQKDVDLFGYKFESK